MRQLVAICTIFFLLQVTDSSAKDTLTVGYNVSPPFVTEKNGMLEGPSIWLCEQLEVDHQLHFDMQKMPLDSLLTKLENGSIDLCASPLTITSERSRKIDFTAPYYIAHSSLLVNYSTRAQEAWSFIKSFFSLEFFEVLGALAIIILIFGFLTWLFERKKNPEEFGQGMRGLWNGFWWSAVTMTTVGYGDRSPQTLGGRIVAIIWMFTAVVIISGFTASIASSLTTDRIDAVSTDIADFKNKPVATIKNSGTDTWLSNNFYNNKILFDDMNECLSALRNDQVDAVAYDLPILKSLVETDSLDEFEILPTKYNPQYYAMGMSLSLSDSLRKEINTSILKHTERMDWRVLLSEYNLEHQ
ncbi:MAG: transporter substrate-binding domain-containing protein [Crocinitomicaceae bacterium]|nr:transporter substrate-binding domain-containing protein [Crocinitomicaceae bacterium]